MTPRAAPSRPVLVAAFAAIYLFWGGTFLALRYAVAEIPPLLTIAVRCLLGGGLLWLWAWRRGDGDDPTPAESAARWRTAALAGLFLFLGGHGLLAWAEQRVTSGQAALVMSAIPTWLVLLDALHRRRLPSRRTVAALALGTLGILVLAGGAAGVGAGAGASVFDYLALVGADLCWAVGSLIGRDGRQPSSAIRSTAMQLTAGGVAVAAASLACGELAGWTPSGLSPRAVLSLAFLVVCGTALAFAAYTWLLRWCSPAAVGSYAYANPLIAVGLAWGVGDEPFRRLTVVAAALVLAAIALTRPAPTRTEPDGPAQ